MFPSVLGLEPPPSSVPLFQSSTRWRQYNTMAYPQAFAATPAILGSDPTRLNTSFEMGDTNDGEIFHSRELPPYIPGKPYVISTQDGEVIYIPLSKSATRLLVTGKETEDAFAIVGSGGSASDPIGFHYHREAHDVFLCLQGSINVWAGEKCRTMEAGDFASVPPVR